MTAYRVVRYEPGLRSAVCRLQQLHWSPNPEVNSAYFAWKYERNPYLREPHVYIAMHGDEPVGMRGVYGARWQIGRALRPFDAPCAADLLIAPEHRDRGVFTDIMDYAIADLQAESVQWLFNLSAGATTRIGSLALQWRAAGQIHRMVQRRHRSAGRWWSRTARGIARAMHGVRIEKTPRPEAMAELVHRSAGDGRIRHVRDARYFAWRFENPLSTYRFIFLGSIPLDAYLVLRTERTPGRDRMTRIADWVGVSAAARRRVLEAALQTNEFLDVWAGPLEEEDKDVLGRAGFVDYSIRSFADYFPCVLVRPVAPQPPLPPWRIDGVDLLDSASWDIPPAGLRWHLRCRPRPPARPSFPWSWPF